MDKNISDDDQDVASISINKKVYKIDEENSKWIVKAASFDQLEGKFIWPLQAILRV